MAAIGIRVNPSRVADLLSWPLFRRLHLGLVTVAPHGAGLGWSFGPSRLGILAASKLAYSKAIASLP